MVKYYSMSVHCTGVLYKYMACAPWITAVIIMWVPWIYIDTGSNFWISAKQRVGRTKCMGGGGEGRQREKERESDGGREGGGMT